MQPQSHTGSYYAATVNHVTDFAPLLGDQSADVCIIGAGFTGISTALHLAERGYDETFGARPLARLIQAEVRDRLTDEILFGDLEGGGTVTIGMAKDGLTFEVDAQNAPQDHPPAPADAD